MNQLTVAPILLAMLVGIALQALDIYQVNAWNLGTVKAEPWRTKTSYLARQLAAAAAAVAWLSRLWGHRRALVVAAVLLTLLFDAHGAAAGGVVLAVVPPVKDTTSWADEIIATAGNAVHDSEIKDLQAEYRAWSEATLAPVRRLHAEIRADGRSDEKPKADEQRIIDRAYKEIGRVQMAVAQAMSLNASGKENRARISGDGARGGSDRDWKSIFPSMSEYKAQTIGTDPAGGYLVEAGVGPFFDRLRPDSVVLSAGPRIELCEKDALELPLLSASTTAYLTNEQGDITESSVSFAKARLPIRKYAAWSKGSSEWFADAAYGPRQIIEQDHRLQLGAMLDHNILEGNGSTVVGLRDSGTATDLAAGGAVPTLDNVADALGRMESGNAKPSAIFMHARTFNTIRKIVDLQDRYQLSPDPTQSSERRLFGIPVFLSNQISITRPSTNAAVTDCSTIIVADMRYVVVVRRQEVQMLYDPFTYSKTDMIALRSISRWGFGVIHAAAVEVLTGVRP